ncbi:Uncharacterised protein [uncultured archaeon]|nr:Uncharacterised protein [uncultured archaeon]
MKGELKIILGLKKARIEHMEELEKKIQSYSPSELLNRGREYIKDSEYFDAKIVFDKLSEDSKMRNIAEIYGMLISATILLTLLKKDDYRSSTLIMNNNLTTCMIESTRMHAEKAISTEDLFNLETMIDRIPFNKIKTYEMNDFWKFYNRFKEYNLDVFLKENEKKNSI